MDALLAQIAALEIASELLVARHRDVAGVSYSSFSASSPDRTGMYGRRSIFQCGDPRPLFHGVRMRAISMFVLLSCSLANAGALAQFSALHPQSRELVEREVAERMQSAGIVGCSVGIVKGGSIVYLKGFGCSDLDNGVPATEQTIYRTGSIAKTFTAVLALQLAEQGRLRLDADVRTLVPEYPSKPQGAMKVGHLLSHRSGIRHYAGYDSSLLVTYEATHPEFDAIDAIDIFKNGSISFTPGSAYQYTTFGFNLLGAVVERAAGMRFQDMLRDNIRRRLALPYLQPEVGRLRPYPEETKGYDRESGTLQQTLDNTGILYKVPGGGMVCTVIDLCLFMQGMMAGAVFDSASTLDAMGTVLSPEGQYGLGCFIGTWNGHRTLSHGGGQEKTTSHYIFVPDTRDGVVVLTNTFGAPADPLSRALLNLVPSLVTTGDTYSPIPRALDVPRRVFPDMDEVIYNPTVMLQWTAVPHADRYVVQSDRSPLFPSCRSDTLRAATMLLGGLAASGAYYWRVRALNPFLYDTAQSAWSDTWRFRTPVSTDVRNGIASPQPAALFLYPNPAADRLQFSVQGPSHAACSLSMWSADGRLVDTWKQLPANGVLDLSHAKSGAYVFRLEREHLPSAVVNVTVVR
jgi:CubicO group peptidase (beta-lactamase class C family)